MDNLAASILVQKSIFAYYLQCKKVLTIRAMPNIHPWKSLLKVDPEER